jgi:hypothetical protein
MHLNTEDLVDIAEGTRPEASLPHLAACEPCRAQLHDLRAMLSAAREVEVPEPSPLFWDHLSARVHDAVAADVAPRSSWLRRLLLRRGVLEPISAVAVVAMLILVVFKSFVTVPAPGSAPPSVSVADAAAPRELLSDVATDDASLTLVASLTDQVDLETAREAGLAPRGSADRAIAHLSDSELRELGRLLKEELARPGA